MEYAIIIAIIMAAGGWIFYPLLKSKSIEKQAFHRKEDRESVLQQRKEEVYAAIKEMDFDYKMGKMSEEDYQELRTQYKGKAAEILKQLDTTNQPDDIEGAIEQEVQQLRKQYASQKESVRSEKSAWQINFCPRCGTKIIPNSMFCQNCGVSLIIANKEELT